MLDEHNTEKYFHTKEGQRRLSSSNEVGDRCPSLISSQEDREIDILAEILVDIFWEQQKK